MWKSSRRWVTSWPTSAVWLVPRLGWTISLWKANPEVRLGTSGAQWPLRRPPNVRASAWSLSLLTLGSFLTLWSPLPSLGPNGNNKAFSSKKKKSLWSFVLEISSWTMLHSQVDHVEWLKLIAIESRHCEQSMLHHTETYSNIQIECTSLVMFITLIFGFHIS